VAQAGSPVAQHSKERSMAHYYWNDWYFGWGWLLWVGFMILIFSGIGNWGYTYRAHRRLGLPQGSAALDILSERYARGELTRQEYTQLKSDIVAP
jgi:putative membrane protein